MADARCKLLMELRHTFEGFGGIAQETRLLFASLAGSQSVELSGLLNSYEGYDVPWPPKTAKGHEIVWRESLLAMNMAEKMSVSRFRVIQRLRMMRRQVDSFRYMLLAGLMSDRKRLMPMRREMFADLIWESAFSKTVGTDAMDRVLGRPFFANGMSWTTAANWCKFPLMRPKLRTQGFDVVLAQMPMPYQLTPGTKLLVRYHDAIPIFMPHLLDEAVRHAAHHYFPLRHNVRDGAHFACTSAPVRDQLVAFFPELEGRAHVVMDIVSDRFYVEPTSRAVVDEILLRRNCEVTDPEKMKPDRVLSMLARNVRNRRGKFFIAVSNIEPRKNFERMLSAWQRLALSSESDADLVIVGSPGTRSLQIMDRIRQQKARGRLFHLWKVPLAELRQLYNDAHAVVCPSRAEGFDLSGVEGMLCGTPVIASDIPVHRSVYEDAAVYVDAYDAAALTKAMRDLAAVPKDQGLPAELREKGLKLGPRYFEERIRPQWEALIEKVQRGVV